jgi:hypothetical protein
MVIWCTAIHRAVYIARRDPDCIGDIPGTWCVSRKDNSRKDNTTTPIAYVLAWIDNSMVVANSLKVRNHLVDSASQVCVETNTQWKGEGMVHFKPDEPVEVIGIVFERSLHDRERTVEWFHSVQNIKRWNQPHHCEDQEKFCS